MSIRYMKKCSTVYNVKEIQIKATMKYCLIPVRMVIKKKKRSQELVSDVEKLNLVHRW